MFAQSDSVKTYMAGGPAFLREEICILFRGGQKMWKIACSQPWEPGYCQRVIPQFFKIL